jgi:hypothetical protein
LYKEKRACLKLAAAFRRNSRKDKVQLAQSRPAGQFRRWDHIATVKLSKTICIGGSYAAILPSAPCGCFARCNSRFWDHCRQLLVRKLFRRPSFAPTPCFWKNKTGFAELQNTVVLELSKWGRFDLAGSREKADLVLRLDSGSHVRAVPDGQYPTPGGMYAFTESEIPRGPTRVALLDPKTNALLWSDAHKTDGSKVKNGHLLDALREAFDAREKGRR